MEQIDILALVENVRQAKQKASIAETRRDALWSRWESAEKDMRAALDELSKARHELDMATDCKYPESVTVGPFSLGSEIIEGNKPFILNTGLIVEVGQFYPVIQEPQKGTCAHDCTADWCDKLPDCKVVNREGVK